MKKTSQPVDLIFHSERFEVRFRRAQRFESALGSNIDYVFAFLISTDEGADSASTPMQSILLLAPGQTTAINAEGTALLNITVAPAFVIGSAIETGMASDVTEILFQSPAVEIGERLKICASDIVNEMTRREPGHGILIASLVEQILVHVLRNHSNARRADNLELTRVGIVDRRIRRAVELMNANIEKDLPLAELAKAAHLSPFHFTRLFKKLTGSTPHAYLASIRMRQAQRLLAISDLPITQIALRVGYASSGHFGKAFRQSTGLSPREYRMSLVGS